MPECQLPTSQLIVKDAVGGKDLRIFRNLVQEGDLDVVFLRPPHHALDTLVLRWLDVGAILVASSFASARERNRLRLTVLAHRCRSRGIRAVYAQHLQAVLQISGQSVASC